MSGSDLKTLINEDYAGGVSMSASDFLNSIAVEVSGSIDDLLRDNEYEIKPLTANSAASAAETFKKFNVLMQDKFRRLAVTAQVRISVSAVRSILSAA
ncbi:MAG: hypothetical protein LBQ47_08210 [Endomicrobium sp.]|jgi:hypothetical protein|nr:hypothetical protein [Endomicrobium sp.]